jgi:cytochrome c-type biogenesis protein
MRHAVAYVAGFGAVFTLLGLTATFAAGPLVDYLPALRIVGGVVLVVLGLNLAGILQIPALERTWRPATSSINLGSTTSPTIGDRIGGRMVSVRGGWLASFGLGAIFAIGWTPCIGIILGGILTLAATSSTALQGTLLLVAYTVGLGLPFLLIAAVYDRAPRILAPLVRHGRVVALVGGLLVAFIGIAMVFDWLSLFPRYFNFNTAV